MNKVVIITLLDCILKRKAKILGLEKLLKFKNSYEGT